MAVAACTLNVQAQSQEYINTLDELFTLAPSHKIEPNNEGIYAELTKNFDPDKYTEEETKAIIDKYFETEYKDKLKNIAVESFYKHISLEELQALIDYNKRPEMQKAKANDNILQKNIIENVNKYLTDNFSNIFEGKEAETIQLKPEIGESYFALVKEYNKCSNTISIIENMKNPIIENMSYNFPEGEVKQKVIDAVNKMFENIYNNLDVIFSNSVYGYRTEEELKTFIQFTKIKEYTKYTNALNEYGNNLVEFALNYKEHFISWKNKIGDDILKK
ncbi:MAG: hypothetical protein HUK07_01940 [Bacteroidaceae bacterium]|nr:hypothetical protein [Bacteroidaceae bacterium]